MKYKCIIVDDEPLAQKILEGYLAQYGHLELIGIFNNALDARIFIEQYRPDILLLDIQMPEETGMALIKSLQHKPITIFATAHINYSVEGFELGVLDYLVKPIRFSRFDIAINRAVELLNMLEWKTKLEQQTSDELYIKSGTKKYILQRKDISHVQGWKDYAIIFCSKHKYIVRSTMKEMESMLGYDKFLRVHKSFIVAKEKLIHYANMKIEFDDIEIPVGRKYKHLVMLV